MDQHSEDLLEQYRNNLKNYGIIKNIVLTMLKQYVNDFGTIVNCVESRIKTEDSLIGKLERKGSKYQTIDDITDIVGARVVTFYMDEVDKFAAKIESNFSIDWENSIDKRKMHNVDQFGYMSLHYICSIPKSMYYDPDNPKINEIKFEIQVRSILQHAWATIQHDAGYKTDVEIPKEYLRTFSRLAGLLEIADDAFCQLRNSIEDYRRRVRQVVKDGTLEDIELNGDSYKAYIENGGFTKLNKHIATIGNMEIEEVPLDNFLIVFKSFGFKTLKELDDFIRDYSDLAYEFSIRQFDGKDIDIITSITGPLALCVVFIVAKDMGESSVKMLLDTVYGERKINQKNASKLTKIAKSMGISTSGDEGNDW